MVRVRWQTVCTGLLLFACLALLTAQTFQVNLRSLVDCVGAGKAVQWTATTGNFSCASGGGSGTVTGLTADSGGTTTGATVTVAGGAGIVTTRASDTVTVTAASGETGFLAAGALTCGAGTSGEAKVHTTPFQYCDDAATPTLQYAAYGSATGVATTATALAANGTNCSAGSYPLGVDASGNAESCTVASSGLTIPFLKTLSMAVCTNATAGSAWDLPAASPAVATCYTGSNTTKAGLAFTTGTSAQYSFLLPADLTGTVDLRLLWKSAQTSATGTWALTAVCTATDATATDDPAFGAFWAPAQDTSPGTANQLKLTTGTSVAFPVSCTASTFMHLKLAWTAGTAVTYDAFELELKVRRAI